MSARNNKHLKIGPGGKKCSCCFPAPKSKARKHECRKAKKEQAKEHLDEQLQQLGSVARTTNG